VPGGLPARERISPRCDGRLTALAEIDPRYPVYVPTRDRFRKDRALTIRCLLKDEVPFRAVVVPEEREVYAELVGEERLLVLPDNDYVLFDSRNWIKDHATAEGHARHWQLDDNIIEFRRLWRGRRIPCPGGLALRVCEDFSDRYENIAISGLNYQMFVKAEYTAPFFHNVHVYSCTLVNNEIPHRWRLVYNDDTDICLQVLADGWCTVLLNAFMANKLRTMTLHGGNTDQLYQGDGRLKMARSLERMWPGVVKIDRRWGRPQHVINWRKFDTPLQPRKDAPAEIDYGLRLVTKRPVKSDKLRRVIAE
jgi:hypothetical protein